MYAAFMISVAAVSAVQLPSVCRNLVQCPCGETKKNVTICLEISSTDDPCSEWKSCKACRDYKTGCEECPEGYHGPWCTKVPEVKKYRRRRTSGDKKKETQGDTDGCPKINKPSNARINCKMEKGEKICMGECNSNFTFENDQIKIKLKCQNGAWKPKKRFPACKRKEEPERRNCSDPGFIGNGYRRNMDGSESTLKLQFRHSESVVFGCNSNKKALHGPAFLTCNNGRWSAALPKCIKTAANLESNTTFCSDPGAVQNGSRKPASAPNERGFPPGSRLEFSCDQNYDLEGEWDLFCLVSGTWSADVPMCVAQYASVVPPSREPMYCDIPGSILDGWFDTILPDTFPGTRHGADYDNLYPEGSRLKYHCLDGYTLMGSSELICQSSGYWSPDPPVCSTECGVSLRHTTRRIIHGTQSIAGEWPWVVAIAVRENSASHIICGGAVLNSRTVVTAAHCLVAESITLYFGKLHRRDSKDDAEVLVRQSTRLIRHPDYNATTFDSDIALIMFEPSIRFTNRIQPICMPSPESTARNLMTGKQGYVTGWGLTEKSLAADELLSAHLPVLSNSVCLESFRRQNLGMPITQNMFCAGFEDGQQAACTGDSGSPLVFYDRSTDRHTLEGLVSFGVQGQCGLPGRYTVFTKVFRFVPWILRIL